MRAEKVQMVNDIGELLNNTDYIFLISYKGLSVENFAELRIKLGECQSKCQVLKNRLIRKAAELHGPSLITDIPLTGDTAIITGEGDSSTVAKVINQFSKSHEAVASKGGYLEGQLIVEEDVKELAALPSRDILYSQLIGVIQAPARNLVSTLNNKVSSIVNVLNAFKNKLEDNN